MVHGAPNEPTHPEPICEGLPYSVPRPRNSATANLSSTFRLCACLFYLFFGAHWSLPHAWIWWCITEPEKVGIKLFE
jgi:hypothetical protein